MPRNTSIAARKGTGSMSGSVLTFDADRHLYFLNGARIPGTSEVLASAGIIDKAKMEAIPEQYRMRGLAVHAWTEAIDLGQVPAGTLIPGVVAPYVAGWERFKRDSGVRILAVEELVSDRILVRVVVDGEEFMVPRFATRVDRRVILSGREGTINLKTGGRYPHYPIQVAMERMCYRPGLPGWCVYLSKEGAYRLEEHTDPRDVRIAESAIRAYYAKSKEVQV